MRWCACALALLVSVAAYGQAQAQAYTPEQERAQAVEDATRINALSYQDAKRLRAKVEEVLRLLDL